MQVHMTGTMITAISHVVITVTSRVAGYCITV